MSGVLCDRKLSAKVKGNQPCFMERKRCSDVKKDGKNGSYTVENGEMGTGSDKKGQDKKRICERDCKNCKVGRQTSECKATLVWARKKEKRRLRGEKDDGDGGAGIRKRGRPKRRWMDLVREDMGRVGAKEGDEVDRVKWRLLLPCGDP